MHGRLGPQGQWVVRRSWDPQQGTHSRSGASVRWAWSGSHCVVRPPLSIMFPRRPTCAVQGLQSLAVSSWAARSVARWHTARNYASLRHSLPCRWRDALGIPSAPFAAFPASRLLSGGASHRAPDSRSSTALKPFEQRLISALMSKRHS